MTQRQLAKKGPQKSIGLTEGEKAAMRETIQERRAGKGSRPYSENSEDAGGAVLLRPPLCYGSNI